MKNVGKLLLLVLLAQAMVSCQKQAVTVFNQFEWQAVFQDLKSGVDFARPDHEQVKKLLFKPVTTTTFRRSEITPARAEPENLIWLKTRLPNWQSGQRILFIAAIDQLAQVYIEDKLLYTTGDFSSPGSLKFESFSWHMVSIPASLAGKDVYFRIYSNHYNIGLSKRIFLAEKADLLLHIFYNDLEVFLISAANIILGIILFLIFLRKPTNQAYLWLALFTIAMGLYLFLRLDIRLFLLSPVNALFYLEIFSLYSVILFLTLFLEKLFGPGVFNTIRYTWWLQLAFIILAAVLALSDGVLLATLPWFQVLMGFSGLVGFAHLVIYSLRGLTYAFTFTMGFMVLFFTATHDVLANVQIIPDWQNLTPFGLTFFIAMLTLILIRRQNRTQKLVRDFSHELIQRKQVEQQLILATEQAQAADKSKTEFLATMSHEIRTPLNIILGMAQLLSEETLTEKQARYISSLKRSGDVLLLLINDLLDISKIEAGKLHIFNEPFDLKKTVAEIHELFSSQALDKELVFELEQDSNIPERLKGDRNRLRQILYNLVSNAIKFTNQGSVKIKSGLIERNEHGCVIEIQVQDTGKGIEPAKLKQVFDPFVQEDTSTTREYGGSGLGLAISLKLAQLMDGGIEVTSEQDKGSTFSLRLNFFTSEQALPPAETGTVDVLPAGLKMLLVEDLEDNRLLVHAFLKDQPLAITDAFHGSQAVEAVQKEVFDVILMDMQMPVLDGYEATAKIRDFEKENGQKAAIIIAVTGNAMPDEIKRAFHQGCNFHLAKPINKASLLSILQQAVATGS